MALGGRVRCPQPASREVRAIDKVLSKSMASMTGRFYESKGWLG